MINMPLSVFTEDESFPFYIQYGSHDTDLYVHTHDNYSELVIVLDGSAEHIVDGGSGVVKKGDVFVISNDTAHGYSNPANFKICNIMFSKSIFNFDNCDIVKNAGFQALFVLEPQYSKQSRPIGRLSLGVEDFVKVCARIEELYTDYYSTDDCRKTACISDFLKLSIALSRLYSFENVSNDENMLNIAKAVAYIEKNYTENISVKKLAELSNYSERQFTRVFSAALGCTPAKYITNLRVTHACRLLESGRLSITEIAQKCGYDDSSYFCRIFSKNKGITPTRYRSNR